MELTPLVPAGRQVIERYAPSGFRITGVIWRSPVLVFPEVTTPWAVADAAALTCDSLQPVVDHRGVQLLLLGLGSRMAPVSQQLRAALRQAGIVVEAMDTGAACRTYNVLMAEDRQIAAALIPPA
ncbi:MAG TPA: Mth938-like domain-containing protein [Stellaceae bacterium]|nr:Mth938-like domain-containing protein [Stellaceae bacterium]